MSVDPPLDETAGLVRSPLPTPMLQPNEVYDPARFEQEMVRVFARSWVWLGDVEDLREPGDYLTGRIGRQPVVVIRQADGGVAGFLNTCRHRAASVAHGPVGHCSRALTCPYHNWTYAIDGRLIGVPDEARMYPHGLPKDDYGLVPIRVEVAWGLLVFGCLSQRAPSFPDWIAPLAPRYDRYRFDTFHRFPRELDETYPINWKVFVENSNDDYHVRFVHRALNERRHNLDTIVRFAGRTCSGFKPHRVDIDDPSGGRTDLDDEVRRGHYADFIYPNLTPLPFPTQLMLVRADPVAPDRTRLITRIYGTTTDQHEQDEQIDMVARINGEDTTMVTELMTNLRSPFVRVGPPSAWEGRAAHVMGLIRADVATPLAPDEFTP